MSGNDLKKCRTVCNIFSNRSDLVQRGCVGNQSVTGYCTIGRFDSGNTAVGTWLTDGTTSIGAKCQVSFPCCHCRTGTARGAARNMLQIPRVSGDAVSGCLCGTSHGELIHVCLSDDHKTCLFQTVNNLGIVLRHKILKDLRCTGSCFSLNADIILNCNRYTGKRSCIGSILNALLYLFCSCIGFFFVSIKISVDLVLFCFDLIKYVFHTVQDAYLMLLDLFRKL